MLKVNIKVCAVGLWAGKSCLSFAAMILLLIVLTFLSSGVYAAEMVTNGNFNNSTSWSLANGAAYDSGNTNSVDGSGSVNAVSTGRNTEVIGTATQTLGAAIPTGSTIDSVSAYVMHAVAISTSTSRSVQIELLYADGTTTEVIFSNNTFAEGISWTTVPNSISLPLTLAQDVTDIIVTAQTKNNNADNSQTSTTWVDDLSIIYTAATGNNTPTVLPIPDQNVNEDATDTVIDLTTYFDDSEDGAAGLTYSVETNTNAGLVTSTITGGTNVTLAYAADAIGTADITIRGTDTGTLWVADIFTVTVAAVNDPPTYGSTEVTAATDGVLYTYNINTSDIEGDTLTLSTPVKPAWLTLSDNGDGTGTLSGTPGPGDVGPNNVTLRVTDDGTPVESADQVFIITVSAAGNQPPTDITLSPNKVADGTDTSGGFDMTLGAADPDGGETFTFTKTGAGADAAKFSISGNTLTLTDGVISYDTPGDANADRIYEVEVQVEDSVTNTYLETLTVTIIPAFNSLIHSSASTSSTKWGGSWGMAGGKYGEFTCATCHKRGSTNIKRVRTALPTVADGVPESPDEDFPGSTIVFQDTRDGSSDFGDDGRADKTQSNNICEVCHTYDAAQSVGVNVHAFNIPSDSGHDNKNDCVTCHLHKNGFDASCTACHGNPPVTDDASSTGLVFSPATTDATNPISAGAHELHAVTESMTCTTCHKGNTMPTVSNTIQMGFEVNNANWSGFGDTAMTGTLDAPDEGTGQMAASFSFVSSSAGTTINKVANNNLTCTVYCHGDWVGNGGQTATSWVGGATMTDDCNDCHGGSSATPPTAGSHTAHASAAGLGLACNKCHPDYADTAHLDGDVAWALATGDALFSASATYSASAAGTTGGKAPSGGYGQCDGIYCHSSGQSVDGTSTAPYVQSSPTWGGGAACGTCHHVTTGAGLTSGSHLEHLALTGVGCDDCHTGAANDASSYVSASHVNQQIDVANTYNAAGVSGNGYGECSAASCHDDGTGTTVNSPTWGVGGSCASCHASNMATGSHPLHLSTTLYAKALCGDCHDGAVKDTTAPAEHTDGNLDVYDAAAGDLGYPSVNANGNGYESCSSAYCHSTGQSISDGASATPTYDTVTWGGAAVCGSCHAVAGLTSGSHSEHLAVTGVGCDNCHTGAANDASTYNSTQHIDRTIDVANTYNAAGVPGNGYGECSAASCHDDGTGTTVNSPTWGGGGSCASCHASDMVTGSHATHLTQSITSALGCGNCHDGAVKDATAPSQHLDGNLDVFDTAAGDLGYPTNVAKGGAPYSSCTTTYCHGDNMPNGDTTGSDTTPLWGSSSSGCDFCHGFPPTPAGTHSGIASDQTVCGGCHDATMTNGSAGITDISLHINGAINVNVSCTGCHSGHGSGSAGIGSDSPHVTVGKAGGYNAFVDCTDCHNGHADGTTGTNDIEIVTTLASFDDKYAAHGGKIQLGGTATASYSPTNEAEFCWGCHSDDTYQGAADISEWDGSHATYDYGSVTSNDLNWISTSWSSAIFAYKNGPLSNKPTLASPGTGQVNGGSTHGVMGGADGVDAVGELGCAACHDVHDTSGGTNNLQGPFLRGTWTQNPFREDGAPGRTGSVSTWTDTQDRGNVPRASAVLGDTANNEYGGWQIEQNNANFSWTDYPTDAGLCNTCHTAASIESGTTWTGHNAVVPGFGGSDTASNIFDVSFRMNTGIGTALKTYAYAYPQHMQYTTHTDYPDLHSGKSTWMNALRETDDVGVGIAPGINAAPTSGGLGTTIYDPTKLDTSVAEAFHNFPCAKCHNPHASRLPKLLITNCLNVENNTWDDGFDPRAYSPGVYTAKELAYNPTTANCHRYVRTGDTQATDKGGGNYAEPGWNSVTPWQ